VPLSTIPYLNNVLDQDHRFIKKRIAASLWFRSVGGALSTIAGYEAMHMSRKVKSAGWRRAMWSGKSDSSTKCTESLLDSWPSGLRAFPSPFGYVQ